MKNQVEYYDRFGSRHADSILDCPHPEFWTTDYIEQGRVYHEMKERVMQQQKLVNTHFRRELPVLDLGCGFGRQASWLAQQGFAVTGTDSSKEFIEIAKEIFRRKGFIGKFFVSNIEDFYPEDKFRQVLLLDVLEHIPAGRRRKLVAHIAALTGTNAVMIVSLPRIKTRLTSRVNNLIVRRIKSVIPYFGSREEHPFPIPAKSSVLRLFTPYFMLDDFLSTAETDYYIFRKDS